ncbi:enoyl-CoA hydratase-related protein [Alteribacillus iranensis]|uniref:Enoyl-CoA hydratase/carnithine racemase n=1 Tax=Alteribacillus iranensis TaxID=930128 RepID=A0A1I2CRS0_9BACI|nr:enoyl-CoA hydratase-related protein [Alteribacillus iranensis]SFE71011.1 Enoyl-CoA hydratase/carnithine racemase [Alteribacillus iranensis]
MDKILLEREGHLASITINRPERLNCFDYETLCELEETVEQIQTDRDIRMVLITGAGEKAFSAGADLKERRTLTEKEVRRNVNKIRTVFTMIEELPQPTIAAINGYALGGGFELALACDFRYAAEHAILGLPEVSMAIIPGGGGTQRLTKLIGPSKAKELILTARRIPAAESENLGIVNQVTRSDAVIEKSKELAEEIMQNGPLAVIQAKYAIHHGSNVDSSTGMAIESKAYEVIIPTEDRLEALEAFKEKRQPKFQGK